MSEITLCILALIGIFAVPALDVLDDWVSRR